MFFGAFGMFDREKVVVEMNQCLFHGFSLIILFWYKGIFQRIMVFIMVLKKGDKVKEISGIEGAVHKAYEWFEVGILMMQYKIIWFVVHPLHQFAAVADDGGAVAPC